MGDAGELERIARRGAGQKPGECRKISAGNEGVLKFFIGQVMRETRGQADPQS